MASMIGPAAPRRTWTGGTDRAPPPFDIRAEGQVRCIARAAARPASSAGRIARGRRRRRRHGGAAEREVGHRGEARLVLAQREQQVRRAVGRRQLAVDLHAPAVDAPAARAARAARPPRPTSQAPSAPRSSASPVRACRSRASWPSRSPSRPSAVRSGASPARGRGRTTFAPRFAYSAGIPHACTTRDRRDRERQRLERHHQHRRWRGTGSCARAC